MAKSKAEDWLTTDSLALLECWARDGLTDEQIANKIGIDVRTLYRWKDKHSHICQSLKKGKEVVDYEVENALLKKCFGYNTQVKKNMKVKRTEYNEGFKVKEYEEIIEVYDEVHIPADTTAQIFWLKNRKPDKWREKPKELQEQNIQNEKENDSYINALNNKAREVWDDVNEE